MNLRNVSLGVPFLLFTICLGQHHVVGAGLPVEGHGRVWKCVASFLDTDDSGKLSADEIADAVKIRRGVFVFGDNNDNELLDASELTQFNGLFEGADADADGALDATELEVWLKLKRQELSEHPSESIDLSVLLDANKDGTLTEDELADTPSVRAAILAAADKDNDESLSYDEMAQIREPVSDGDTDGDGIVGVTELEDWIRAWRERIIEGNGGTTPSSSVELADGLDFNKDGVVTEDELADTGAVRVIILALADKDQDGVLSEDELANIREPVSDADSDENGSVDDTELDNWIQLWRQKLIDEAKKRGSKQTPLPVTDDADLMSYLDEDKDGVISADELADTAAVRATILKLHDSNDDGELSEDELANIREPVSDADKDESGSVDVTELEGWIRAWRERLISRNAINLNELFDFNQDNQVTKDELADLDAAQIALLALADLNRDKLLTADELARLRGRSMSTADSNRDAVVDSIELAHWLRAWFVQLGGTPMPVNPQPVVAGINLNRTFDFSQDGKLTADELAEDDLLGSVIVRLLDRDDNGMLSSIEIADVRQPIAAADKNADGFLDSSELAIWIRGWRLELIATRTSNASR